jgi:hypothetical protein
VISCSRDRRPRPLSAIKITDLPRSATRGHSGANVIVAASLCRGALALLLADSHGDTRHGGQALPWLQPPPLPIAASAETRKVAPYNAEP